MLKQEDLELTELNQYYGTLRYYKGWLNVNLTDGVKYVSDNGYGWLITDCISVIKTKLKDQEFLVVKLVIEDSKAVMTIDDGNKNILYTQKYDYTDGKIKELKMYYRDNVLMLTGEY